MAQKNAGHADILVERSRLCNAKGAGLRILTKIADCAGALLIRKQSPEDHRLRTDQGRPEGLTHCVAGMGATLAGQPENRECPGQFGFVCGTPV
jgi:hypothetical protein